MTLGLAASIGHGLARDAVWHERECTWIGRCPPSRSGPRGYQALGPDLFVGTAGIGWFLAEVYAATRDPLLRRTALGAIRHAAHGALMLPRERRLALHAGAAGIAVASAVVALRTGDEESSAAAARLIEIAFSGAPSDRLHDLATGAAGTIVAAIALAKTLGVPSLLPRAAALADRLLALAERTDDGISWRSRGRGRYRNLAGMAHGASGIAVALLEVFAATGDAGYRDAALEGFRYERSLFDPVRRNWPDLSNAKRTAGRAKQPFVAWWCHGAPGIALARIRACEILGAGEWAEEAQKGVRTTLAALEGDLNRGSNEPALCHGLAGNAAILLEGLPHLTTREKSSAHALISRAAGAAHRLVTRDPIELPALFTGAAGVGWLNLRMAGAPVPSVLLLRPEELAHAGAPPRAHRYSREAPRA